MAPATRIRRSSLLLIAGLLALAACDPATRIEGELRLAAGKQAPDDSRHTLFVAAYPKAAVIGSGSMALVACSAFTPTSLTPTWVEFTGVRNADFHPTVAYAIGGAGGAKETNVFVWWKVTTPERLDFACPAAGDIFGAYPANPVFPGQNGLGGGAQQRGVDITLDRTL